MMDFVDDKTERVYIYLDVIFEHAKLVDGNAIRFPTRGSVIQGLPFPEEKYDEWEKLVVPALIKYTRKHSQSLDPEVKDWLLKNFIKPYDEVTLYRAFRLKFDKTRNLDDNVSSYLYQLRKKATGLSAFTDCQVGAKIMLTRQKESSWTTSPVIATAFTSGLRIGNMNFLIKATVPSEKVLMDFTLLPVDEKKNFPLWGQNEVIVDNYAIPAVINKMWVDEEFSQWLLDHGFKFVVQKGIFKK